MRAMFSDTVQDVILDDQGRKVASPLDGVQVTVYKLNEDGTKEAAPATIYTSRTTGATKANPFVTVDGVVEFWAEPGAYSVDFDDTVVPDRIANKSVHFEAVPGGPNGISAQQLPEYGRSLAPAGVVLPYGGAAAPTGWYLCDGTKYQQSAEATLFAAIGTTYNRNDGSEGGSEFRVPDLRGRAPVGTDNMGTGAAGILTTSPKARGNKSGEEFHLNTSAETGIKSHGHGVTDNGHAHSSSLKIIGNGGGGITVVQTRSDAAGIWFDESHSGDLIDVYQANTGISVNAVGDADAQNPHNNMQPYIVLNYIIKR